MNVWIALAVGIFIGWIIEWVIDWLYWRRNLAAFYATETELRDELAAAEAQVAELTAANSALRGELDDDSRSQALVSSAVTVAAADDPASLVADGAEDAEDTTEDGSVDDASAEEVVANADTLDAVLAAAVNMALAADTSDPEPDDLTKISGIGPVYRRKLHEAGIYTFTQLADASSEQLNAAIAPEGFQKPDYDQWIADAGKLTAGEANADDGDGEEG